MLYNKHQSVILFKPNTHTVYLQKDGWQDLIEIDSKILRWKSDPSSVPRTCLGYMEYLINMEGKSDYLYK